MVKGLNKLARCIHTGNRTCWRTKAGEPALSAPQLRIAMAHRPPAELAAALKNPGVSNGAQTAAKE